MYLSLVFFLHPATLQLLIEEFNQFTVRVIIDRSELLIPFTNRFVSSLLFFFSCCCCCCIASVVSNSVRPHRRQPTRLHHPWDSPGKNPGVGCHFLLHCMRVKNESEVVQSCPTLSDPMDCSPPGSSIHGIFQARVLGWDAIAFSSSSFTAFLLMIFYSIMLWIPFLYLLWISGRFSPCGYHQVHIKHLVDITVYFMVISN